MTILSAQSICSLVESATDYLEIHPFEPESQKAFGLSYGLTAAGYDIRVGQMHAELPGVTEYNLPPGHFALFSSLERVKIPDNLQVIVHDKSTWARQGLALQNTVLEPGWEGHITLELSNHGNQSIMFQKGMPIAQLIFHQLDHPTFIPYGGKYQNQGEAPVKAIFEETNDA